MVDLSEIRDARNSGAGRVHRTPLFLANAIGRKINAQLFLKAEFLQKTGSFKVRGVLNKIRRLTPEQKAAGLVTFSAGNHAQALAYAASSQSVKSTIVMPATASPMKVQATRDYGAEVILHGTALEAFHKMQEVQKEHGYTLVHPYDDYDIIAGHGTAGLEIMEDLPDADVVIVPVGGGGLISGIATAVKALRPATRVFGVEPTGAASLRIALEAGRIIRLEAPKTIADGLAAPMTGEKVLEHVRAFVDDVVLVSDDEIRNAMKMVLERCKFMLEPAGAAGIAALLAARVPIGSGARVVAVASGGNIDYDRLKSLLS